MKKQKQTIQTPKIPEIKFLMELPNSKFDESESYDNIILSNSDITGEKIDYVSLKHSYLKNITMKETQFMRFDISDVCFENCDLANAKWEKPILHRIEFVGCRLTGINMIESYGRNIIFKDCNGKFGSFRFGNLQLVSFENCNLSSANFQKSELSNVRFINCDLRNLELSGAKLKETDFRGSKIEGIRVSINDMRGSIIDPNQAADILEMNGLKVKWVDDL